jgi:siroheme synthase-like protein
MDPMIFLPITINITDKDILMIGGGKVTLEKLISLKQYTNRITIITEKVDPQIEKLPFKIILKSYEKNDLKNYFLVYACTNNKLVNAQIKKDCNDLDILVNVADTRDSCDFISPAIFKKDYLSVAVSSNGEDVRLSLKVRNSIKKMFEDGII